MSVRPSSAADSGGATRRPGTTKRIMKLLRTVGLLLLALNAVLHASAPAALADDRTGRLPRIAIEEPVSGPAASELRAADLPVPVLARVSATLETDVALLDARLAQLASRKTPVWLAVTAPSAVEGVERWRTLLQGVLSRHGASLAIVEIDVGAADPKLAAYVLRLAATDVRAEREAIRVAVGGAGASGDTDLYNAELAPYLDLLVLPDGADLTAALARLARVDPGAQLAVTGLDAGPDGGQAVRRVIDSELRNPGNRHCAARVAPVERARARAPRAGPDCGADGRWRQRARCGRRKPGALDERPRRHQRRPPSPPVRRADVCHVSRLLERSVTRTAGAVADAAGGRCAGRAPPDRRHDASRWPATAAPRTAASPGRGCRWPRGRCWSTSARAPAKSSRSAAR